MFKYFLQILKGACSIGLEGAKAIGNALKFNDSLILLYLCIFMMSKT